MAFFRCGGNKTATIIDGVESGKDLNLKSINLYPIFVDRLPDDLSISGAYSRKFGFGSSITHDQYLEYFPNMIRYQDYFYFIGGYGIIYYKENGGEWGGISFSYSSSLNIINIIGEVNGVIYAIARKNSYYYIVHCDLENFKWVQDVIINNGYSFGDTNETAAAYSYIYMNQKFIFMHLMLAMY